MQSRKLGAGVAVAALAVAVALFVVLREDEGDPNDAPAATTTATTTTDETSGDGGDRGGGADPEPDREEPEAPEEPALPTVTVRDGEPVGGVAELDFQRAEQVRFVVRSNTDDEVHVHGYDVYADIVAGERNVVSFPAAFEGVFEVELHGAGVEIARLAVTP